MTSLVDALRRGDLNQIRFNDYAQAARRYDLNQGLGAQAIRPVQGAGPADALLRVLSGYFAGKGMRGAEQGMDTARQEAMDSRALALSRALGAFRGDTPYQQSEAETFPGEPLIQGLRMRGQGQNRMALAESLTGSQDPALQNVGLSTLLAQPAAPKAPKIAEIPTGEVDDKGNPYMQKQQFVNGGWVNYGAPYLKKGVNVETNVSTAPKLPTGYEWIDVNDPGKGVKPIKGSDKDPAVKSQSELKKLDLVSRKVSGALDRYEAQFSRTGAKVVPDAEKMALNTAYKDLMLQLKELFNLGVLNGPDLQIMEEYVQNPTTGLALFYEAIGGKKGFENQIKLVRDKVQSEIQINREVLMGESPSGLTPEEEAELDALEKLYGGQ